MNIEAIKQKYRQQVRENRIHQRYERSVGAERAYIVFDSTAENHDRDIHRMCPEGLDTWVKNREQELGHKPAMLVLLGQVGLLRELDVPGISVALTDDRDEATKQSDFENRRALIEGDVLLYKNTFGHVRQAMDTLGINEIDLALTRGVQGGLWVTDSVEVNGKVLNEVVGLLSPNGGQFMMNAPHPRSEELLPVLDILKQCPNLETQVFPFGVGNLISDIKFTKNGEVNLESFWREDRPNR